MPVDAAFIPGVAEAGGNAQVIGQAVVGLSKNGLGFRFEIRQVAARWCQVESAQDRNIVQCVGIRPFEAAFGEIVAANNPLKWPG